MENKGILQKKITEFLSIYELENMTIRDLLTAWYVEIKIEKPPQKWAY